MLFLAALVFVFIETKIPKIKVYSIETVLEQNTILNKVGRFLCLDTQYPNVCENCREVTIVYILVEFWSVLLEDQPDF